MSVPLAVVAMVAVLLATGCATRGSVTRLQDEVESLRVDVADLRQAHETSAAALGESHEEIRALDAHVIALQTGSREASEEIARLRARLQTTDDELRRLATLAAAPAPAPAPVLAPAPPRGVHAVDGAEHVYAAALATFRSREYGQAVLDFLDFIAKFPRHPLAPHAQYWIAEAYYVQRDYRQAMTELGKIVELYPASPKAADALVKVGLCYTNLRDPARARQTWQRVVATYPSTEAAAIAKTLMQGRAVTRGK